MLFFFERGLHWVDEFINNKDSDLIHILGLFCIITCFSDPTHWSGNEINYFQLSTMKVSDANLYKNFSIFDGSVGRDLPFFLMGNFIKMVGDEAALVIISFLSIALYSISIAFLSKKMNVSPLASLSSVMIFILVGQNYFAGGWLFGGVEAKVFSYAFVILSLGFMLEGGYIISLILSAIAVYLHFLVGGFWGISVLLFIFLKKTDVIETAKFSFFFLLLIFPLITYLGIERLRPIEIDVSGIQYSAEYIYAAIRNPHHIAPFSSKGHLYAWSLGYAYIISSIFVIIYFTIEEKRKNNLVIWILSLFLYLFLAFFVAFFDRNTHIFSALYLFRPNSLLLLLTILFLVSSSASILRGGGRYFHVVLFIAIAVPFFAKYGPKFAYNMLLNNRINITKEYNDNEWQAVNWVKRNTNNGDIIILQKTEHEKWLAFESIVNRPTLVNYKFVPTLKSDIYEWYKRIKWKEKIFAGNCEAIGEYPVKYLLFFDKTADKMLSSCSKVVWENEDLAISKIVK